jgi:hypothetical protein
MLIVEPTGSRFHFIERSVRHNLFGLGVDQNFSGLTHWANEWISKKDRYTPNAGRNVKLWTAGQKPIRQIVRQEKTRRSLSFDSGDRREEIGDHDSFIIAMFMHACETGRTKNGANTAKADACQNSSARLSKVLYLQRLSASPRMS